ENVRHMPFDSRSRNHKQLCDLPIGQSTCQRCRNLALSRCQWTPGVRICGDSPGGTFLSDASASLMTCSTNNVAAAEWARWLPALQVSSTPVCARWLSTSDRKVKGRSRCRCGSAANGGPCRHRRTIVRHEVHYPPPRQRTPFLLCTGQFAP